MKIWKNLPRIFNHLVSRNVVRSSKLSPDLLKCRLILILYVLHLILNYLYSNYFLGSLGFHRPPHFQKEVYIREFYDIDRFGGRNPNIKGRKLGGNGFCITEAKCSLPRNKQQNPNECPFSTESLWLRFSILRINQLDSSQNSLTKA